MPPLPQTPAKTPLKTSEGKKVYDKGLTSEVFATIIEDQIIYYLGQDIPEIENVIRALAKSNILVLDYTTTAEVWKIISHLPSLLGKPLEYDSNTNTAYKNLLKITMISLTNILTFCLRFGCFPAKWKNTS